MRCPLSPRLSPSDEIGSCSLLPPNGQAADLENKSALPTARRQSPWAHERARLPGLQSGGKGTTSRPLAGGKGHDFLALSQGERARL
jgi:hypothetical protein